MRTNRTAKQRSAYVVELTPEAFGAMHAEARRNSTSLRQTASRLILDALNVHISQVPVAYRQIDLVPTEPTIWQRICRACKEF